MVKVEEIVVEEHWRVSGEAGAVTVETNLELSSDISLSSCQKHNQARGLSTLSDINKYLQIYFLFCFITTISFPGSLAD